MNIRTKVSSAARCIPLLLAFLALPTAKAQTSVPVTITQFPLPLNCPSQSNPFDPAKIMQNARYTNPNNDIVLVSAHRGYWDFVPENSTQAIDSVVANCIEMAEIDVRLTQDGLPVALHDWNLQRETDGAGLVYNITGSQFKSLHLKSRRGDQTNILAPALLDLLPELYANPSLILVVDCKDMPTIAGYPTSYAVLQAAWSTVVQAEKIFEVPPGSFRDRIVFKVRFPEIPADPSQVFQDLNTASPCSIDKACLTYPYSAACSHLNLVAIWYLQDNIPQSMLDAYMDISPQKEGGFFWYPEPVVPYWGSPRQNDISAGLAEGSVVTAFQAANDWPEGTSMGTGLCCRIRNTGDTLNTSTSNPSFFTSDFEYAYWQGFNLFSTDKAFEAMSYLQARGKRNICRITQAGC